MINTASETPAAYTSVSVDGPTRVTLITPSLHTYVPRRKNFIQRNCGLCIRICKWIPVVVISSVLFWGYYAYNIELCVKSIQSVILKTFLLVCFQFFFFMCLWSYYQTIFTKPAQVPREFWLRQEEMTKLNIEPTEEARKALFECIISERNLPILGRTFKQGFRTCEKCNLLKPDRAHHCSVCDACILKMDHHCPWVNNCVCFSNYKFFVLFLGYSLALCSWSALVSLPYFIEFWRMDLSSSYGKLHIIFLFFVSVMFAVSLASLFFYHLYLTMKNKSTLEAFRTPIFRYGPDKKAYDLGKSQNFKQIFGDDPILWLLPVSTSKNCGVIFPTRIDRFVGKRVDKSYGDQ